MSGSSHRTLALAATAIACFLMPPLARADCQPQDLTVVLNTGWDQTAGAPIPPNTPDDDWDVTSLPSGSISPIDAGVINAHPAWLTMPQSSWISANATGPSGLYTYRTCWCIDDDFSSPNLNFAIRADDQADVYVNGTLVLSLPSGTFNDALALGMSVNPALLHAGTNCMEVVVDNTTGPTGFDLVGTMTAEDGLCCGCLETDILDDASTGEDDAAGGLIATGMDDDEWVVTASASGGLGPAEVIDTFIGWNVIPFTKWISADEDGPNGHYVYEKCWCMNTEFQNATLSMALLADNQASVFLNGTPIGSTPPNAFLFPVTSITTGDQSLFKPGKNCVTIDVTNTSGVVTGLDVDMTISAVNAECCPCAELPPDAEGWWPLDETVGPTAFELLNDHDGTWLELPPPTGPAPHALIGEHVNNSLTLDGINDYVEVPDEPGLDFGVAQDFTFDAWIKTGSPIRQAIIHKKKPGLPPEPGYRFMTAGVLTLEIADGTSFQVCNGTINVADDEWHFVAATVDRDLPGGITRIRLYVDDLPYEECSSTAVSGSLENAEQLYFGAGPLNPVSGRLWWKGRLDEIEIFRRALTPTEVAAIRNALNTGKCPPEPCEDSTGIPVCAGACPPGLTCVAGPQGAQPCECVLDTESCEGSLQGACNGPCPDPDDSCVGNGPDCFCEPPPQCNGPGDYPTCDGACPAGFVCQEVVNACGCVEVVVPCGETFYPECGGDCPPGEVCENVVGTNFCECEPAPLDCADSPYPVCNGACPANQECKIGPNQTCACIACGTGVPYDPSGPIVVTLPFQDEIRWTPVTCALVYNVYRGIGPGLIDQNDDGLADDYGSCYIGDIIDTRAVDPLKPQPGAIHWYLVTAENFAGEGPLGENSSGQTRQTTSPCP